MKSTSLKLAFLYSAIVISCNTKQEIVIATIDTCSGIEYVYKNTAFAETGYMLPVKIISSQNVPENIDFKINGKRIEVIKKLPGHDEIFKDLKKPIPYIEIKKIQQISADSVELRVFFPSTNSEYWMHMRKNEDNHKKIRLTADIQY
jgi:hypothetical protein